MGGFKRDAALVVGLLSLSSGATLADDFYRGKTINIVVGYSAGGGYDQYARTLSRHMPRHIPGQPGMIVQNLPGAASLLAIRHVETNAARDGTAIAMFDPGLITAHLGPDGTPKLDLTQFRWIGAMLRDVRVCYAWGATGVRTWDDLVKRKEFLIGATARGANAYVNGLILRKVMDAPVRQIAGYPGSNEQRMAVERGELEGNCASWSALPPEWMTGKKVNVFTRFSTKRPADMPESVPYIGDLTSDVQKKELIAVLNAPGELGRPFVLAKQVPDEQLTILRKAFEETLQDGAFLEEMKKQTLPLDPVAGAEAEEIVRQIYATKPAVLKKVVELLE
ncbi:MAG: tripartite tricarboxylate transporter family receptor [Hyphomicrobiales bacterium]|jgi:tripartite-type tricarboxylate transporter receptor subunit TctC|nr:tripartite tricarboxylate transporter family receptor [Hyphomicrobiales bacterium]